MFHSSVFPPSLGTRLQSVFLSCMNWGPPTQTLWSLPALHLSSGQFLPISLSESFRALWLSPNPLADHLTPELTRNGNWRCSSMKSDIALFIHFHSSFLSSSLRRWGFPLHIQNEFSLMCPSFILPLLLVALGSCSVYYSVSFLSSTVSFQLLPSTPPFAFQASCILRTDPIRRVIIWVRVWRKGLCPRE